METIEDLQIAGLKFVQNDRVFRFGTDAVLLASFCDLSAKDRVVDLGTGSGILPLLLYGHTGASVIGIEIQQEAFDLAVRNVKLNSAEDRITMIKGDLREARKLVDGKVTAVLCNPPYDRKGSGAENESEPVRLARHEELCTLEDVAMSASSLLQTGGRFYMIHRASRMAEAIALLEKYRLTVKVLRLVAPSGKKEPNYVLIKAIRDAAPGLRILPTLNICESNGEHTGELKKIYNGEY